MALQKSIKTDFGVDATYWYIAFVQESFTGNTLFVRLLGYKDKATREDLTMQPLKTIEMVFQGDDFISDMNRSDIYNKLKTNPPFDGSVDVL